MPNFIVTKSIQETYLAVADSIDQAEKSLEDGTAVLTTRNTSVMARPQQQAPPTQQPKPPGPSGIPGAPV